MTRINELLARRLKSPSVLSVQSVVNELPKPVAIVGTGYYDVKLVTE